MASSRNIGCTHLGGEFVCFRSGEAHRTVCMPRTLLGAVAIVVALIMLLVTGFLALSSWRHYDVAFAKRDEARCILTLNEALIDGIRDAETSQRGVLLTGRAEYLNPYYAALDRIPSQLSQRGDQRMADFSNFSYS